MPIKYEYNYSKSIKNSRWKHMVAISFVSPTKRRHRTFWRRPGIGTKKQYLSEQQEFLKFMAKHYGSQEDRWSIRWSDYGVDIRFQNEEDAGSFILFFTENSQPRNMVETPVSV